MKASAILHEIMLTASKKDREKVHTIFVQLKYWLGNFKNFGISEFRIMDAYFNEKIDNMVITDPEIISYLKNAIQTKLKEKRREHDKLRR